MTARDITRHRGLFGTTIGSFTPLATRYAFAREKERTMTESFINGQFLFGYSITWERWLAGMGGRISVTPACA